MPDNGWSAGDPTPTPEECEEWMKFVYGSVEEFEKLEATEQQKEIEGKALFEQITPIDSSGNTMYKMDEIAKEYEFLDYDDFSRRYFPYLDDSRLDLIEISISGGIVSQIAESRYHDWSDNSFPYIEISDSSGTHSVDCYLDSINELDNIKLDDSLNIRGLIDLRGTTGSADAMFGLYPCKTGENIKESVRTSFDINTNPPTPIPQESIPVQAEKTSIAQPPTAIKNLTEELKLDPQNAQDYIDRGVTYAEMGKFQESIPDFTQAIKLDPSNAKAYFNRGLSNEMLGKYTDALPDYTQAIKLDPNNAVKVLQHAYGQRAFIYYMLDDDTQAISDWTQFIKLDPNSTDAYTGRGVSNENLGKYTDALSDFDHALRLDSSNEFARSGKARVSKILGYE